MGCPRRRAVQEFLQELKSIITDPRVKEVAKVLVPRAKNKCFISELELRIPDVWDVILGLSVENYCEGPVFDDTEPGDFWIFGTRLRGKEVYIKLKLAKLSILKVVRVVSFHQAEQPLSYPFA